MHFLGMHSCVYSSAYVCICVSARAKVLTSIKYTITLYMYINMRNRGYSRGLEGRKLRKRAEKWRGVKGGGGGIEKFLNRWAQA